MTKPNGVDYNGNRKLRRSAYFVSLIQDAFARRRKEDYTMITDARSLGKAIRQLRKDLGYTQSFLADFSGLSVSFISDLENGKSTAALGNHDKLTET